MLSFCKFLIPISLSVYHHFKKKTMGPKKKFGTQHRTNAIYENDI